MLLRLEDAKDKSNDSGLDSGGTDFGAGPAQGLRTVCQQPFLAVSSHSLGNSPRRQMVTGAWVALRGDKKGVACA